MFDENFENTDTTTTPPPLPTELSSSLTPPPLPTEMSAATTPPPIPQEYKIDQVVNRYTEAFNDIQQAENVAHSAQEREAQMSKRATTSAINSEENFNNKPENGLANMARYVDSQIKTAQWGKSYENLTKAEGNLQQTQKEVALNLGGEAASNSSSILHDTSAQRLETLIDANKQAPIENASQAFTSSFDRQDELAKQLKEEANKEQEQKQLETFINVQIRSVENYANQMKKYGREATVSSSPIIIEFCARSAMAKFPVERLPLDKTAGQIANEKWNNTDNIYNVDPVLSTMTELEQSFFSKLSFISQAEKSAIDKGEAFDLERFNQVYEKAKQVIGNNHDERYRNLMTKAGSYISRFEGVDWRTYVASYPIGMLQEFMEITGHSTPQEITETDLTNIYAYTLAYSEKGIDPVAPNNFLIGLAMIESRGLSNKNAHIQNFSGRFYGVEQKLPTVTKKMENVMHSMPSWSIKQNSFIGQMQQWQITH